MGTSTDGILAYGYDLGGPDEGWEHPLRRRRGRMQRADDIRRKTHCTSIYSTEGMKGFHVCIKNVGHIGVHLASDGRTTWTDEETK